MTNFFTQKACIGKRGVFISPAEHRGHFYVFGLTPLIAGLRCVVMSELGEEVEIPEETT